ncbi:MAG: hypothetical protein ACR5K5_03440, partial [Wolbachia sp.]
TARKHIPRTDNFIILNMETKGAKPFPKSPIYCFLNHSAERILTWKQKGLNPFQNLLSIVS